jgi:predicted TIM-barrel fold metal-dependent hydrolase
MRLIATEEAFAPPEYIAAYLDLATTLDTPASRYLANYYGTPQFARELTDLDYRLDEMDRLGVDMHLLSITGPGVQAFDAALGCELARIANDTLAAAIARHPTRYAGLAAVAPQEPAIAAREIERAMTELRLNGVIINSHTHGEYLDDRKFWPILEAAVACKAPLYLHPTIPSDAMIAPFSQYGMMGALWGFGADASLHVVRMMLGGVFDAFPTLQVVLGHLGEALPFWLDRLDNRYSNIKRRGLSPLAFKPLERLPSEYFATNFHVTTSGMMTAPPLDFCLRTLGEDRVMFAIDYPFEQSVEAVDFIRGAALSDEARRKITHANAETLFRIAPQNG